jgi:hypothetical protein
MWARTQLEEYYALFDFFAIAFFVGGVFVLFVIDQILLFVLRAHFDGRV